MDIKFVVNNFSGTIPFYIRLTDLSDITSYTSASDYIRTWSITNLRTSEVDFFTSTSASTNYCISANSILNDTYTISFSAVHFGTTSAAMISSCGLEEPIRFDSNRQIDLQPYLPSYLKETEVNELINFFQEFLNTLHQEKIYTTSATEFEINNRPKISILEKINRLSDLQDPDLIDIEYIQFFANNLGYSIDLSRGELGILEDQNSNDPATQEDVKRYLRFVVSNLPNWYKIKTTNNAVKIMLYSFGLVGDLITRFTSDYKTDNGGNWINFREGRDSYENIGSNFYPTSHFVVSVELDESLRNFSLNNSTRYNVINAIESIRPINTVSDGVLGHVHRDATVYVRAYLRERAYFRFNL
jgi:hypothetical protein